MRWRSSSAFSSCSSSIGPHLAVQQAHLGDEVVVDRPRRLDLRRDAGDLGPGLLEVRVDAGQGGLGGGDLLGEAALEIPQLRHLLALLLAPGPPAPSGGPPRRRAGRREQAGGPAMPTTSGSTRSATRRRPGMPRGRPGRAMSGRRGVHPAARDGAGPRIRLASSSCERCSVGREDAPWRCPSRRCVAVRRGTPRDDPAGPHSTPRLPGHHPDDRVRGRPGLPSTPR